MEQELLSSGTHLRPGVTRLGLARTGTAPMTTVALAAVAMLVGALLGLVAALADGASGGLGVALSLPGLWIAGALLVAGLAGSARRGALSAAAFLIAGMVAYYAAKQVLTGSVPGPLAIFWLGLAAAVGLGAGGIAGTVSARRWGPVALAATVAGWLLAEAVLVPSAPWTELLLALLIAGLVVRAGRHRGRAPWIAGATLGGAGAALVFSVLPDVLSRVL